MPVRRLMSAIARRGRNVARRIVRPLRWGRSALTTQRTSQARFYFYNSIFDLTETMRRHAASNLRAEPHYLTNFLGVRIDPKFLPGILDRRAGQIEPFPAPANWHADIAEWGAVLRAVECAGENFTVVELGCGWGCWMNNSGVAARRMGKSVDLIGIEGDHAHTTFAREACQANGFSTSEVTIEHGIVAARAGLALFPRHDVAGTMWGSAPILNASDNQLSEARSAGTHHEIPMIALSEIIGDRPKIDLLHIDIQGGESALVSDTLAVLTERVAYIVIGTHSRQIEGELFDLLIGQGWVLEVERPAILSLDGGVPAISVDGVQGWRNPQLT